MKNIPNKIYLQIGDIPKSELKDLDFNSLVEVSWASERIYPSDIEFVLKTDNELGVSDVARGEHGALHEVGKCNASGQDTAKPSATDVDGALEKIIDVKEVCNCFAPIKKLDKNNAMRCGWCFKLIAN